MHAETSRVTSCTLMDQVLEEHMHAARETVATWPGGGGGGGGWVFFSSSITFFVMHGIMYRAM